MLARSRQHERRVRVEFERRQAQRLHYARNLRSVLDEAPQAAGNQFGFEETTPVTRQRVPIDVRDLTIICGDAGQKLTELFGEGRVDVGQLGGQLVALGLDPVIEDLTPLVLFLRLHLFEPLTQVWYRGLQTLALRPGVLY